jgi:hypothetical protein
MQLRIVRALDIDGRRALGLFQRMHVPAELQQELTVVLQRYHWRPEMQVVVQDSTSYEEKSHQGWRAIIRLGKLACTRCTDRYCLVRNSSSGFTIVTQATLLACDADAPAALIRDAFGGGASQVAIQDQRHGGDGPSYLYQGFACDGDGSHQMFAFLTSNLLFS